MISADFEYFAPTSTEEALALLRQHGDEAKLLAGGQSLIPIMKLRLAQPRYIIDIGRLPGLSYIREDDGAIAIGALTTHHMLETSDLLAAKLPLLPETAAAVADVQVRNRGTIGGSLAHADPAADLPAAALALAAQMRTSGPGGQRTVEADDFFVAMLTTALGADEILTEIRFPLPPARSGGAYLKVPNKASHYAIVGVAAAVTLADDGTCRQARIGLTGVAYKPSRATEVEAMLTGKPLGGETIAAAAEKAAEGVDAVSDLHASAEYRLHLTKEYVRRAVELAVSRAQAR